MQKILNSSQKARVLTGFVTYITLNYKTQKKYSTSVIKTYSAFCSEEATLSGSWTASGRELVARQARPWSELEFQLPLLRAREGVDRMNNRSYLRHEASMKPLNFRVGRARSWEGDVPREGMGAPHPFPTPRQTPSIWLFPSYNLCNKPLIVSKVFFSVLRAILANS